MEMRHRSAAISASYTGTHTCLRLVARKMMPQATTSLLKRTQSVVRRLHNHTSYVVRALSYALPMIHMCNIAACHPLMHCS